MDESARPQDWGLHTGEGGALMMGAFDLVKLARQYGTPLHVVHARRLEETAREFLAASRASYPGNVSVHYAMKCNSVPGIVRMIHAAGLDAEVTTEYELRLARQVGFRPAQIIVNGPGKTRSFLEQCLHEEVRLVVADALEELTLLDELARTRRVRQDVLLRVNPDVVPRGMNRGTATASRRGSAFGLDLKKGEVARALEMVASSSHLQFRGFHMHIGTGIRTPDAYAGALGCLGRLKELSRRAGLTVSALDVGGGIGCRTTRGMKTWEMVAYEGLGVLPHMNQRSEMPPIETFFRTVGRSVERAWAGEDLPEIIFEPGRCIAGPNQLLLLTVTGVKHRSGVGTWITADGGLSTVCMPTYYECHAVLLCNDIRRPATEKVTINGPACFAGDIVYRNLPMPAVCAGEILAVMDSGAYFTALESSFGFPRPAIVAVEGTSVRPLRARETYEDMIARDVLD